MKPRDEDDRGLGPDPKRLKRLPLPPSVQHHPKIMKRMAEFAMSPEEAVKAAAATNEIKWLKHLLQLSEFRDKMDKTAILLTEIAAANGHSEAIAAVYEWWDRLDPRQKRRVGCGNAHLLALENGHFNAFVVCQAHYNCGWDLSDGLQTALENGQEQVVDTICKNLPTSKLLRWGAKFNSLKLIKIVLNLPNFDVSKSRRALFRTMSIAAHYGYLKVVKFLNEKFGEKLFRDEAAGYEMEEVGGHDDEDDILVLDCPLATAIKQDHLDVAKYLYANHGYKLSSMETVLIVAASNGSLELVKLFDDDSRCENFATKGFRYAAGSGQLEIMKFFRSKKDFDPSAACDSVGVAVSCNDMEIVKFLYTLEEFKVSASVLRNAINEAANYGHVEMLKYLGRKESITPELLKEAFTVTVTMGAGPLRIHVCVDTLQFLSICMARASYQLGL